MHISILSGMEELVDRSGPSFEARGAGIKHDQHERNICISKCTNVGSSIQEACTYLLVNWTKAVSSSKCAVLNIFGTGPSNVVRQRTTSFTGDQQASQNILHAALLFHRLSLNCGAKAFCPSAIDGRNLQRTSCRGSHCDHFQPC